MDLINYQVRIYNVPRWIRTNPDISVSQIQSSFVVPASGIQDLASFSRVPAVQDENGPEDDSSIHTANIVIIGDRAVGKTSIARVNSKHCRKWRVGC